MYNRPSGVRGLVFGGLMAALVVVCALVPFLSLFMPIPLVLVYVRYGGRVSVLAAIVATLFAMMFVGPIQAFLLLVPGGILPGMVFGYGFRHKLKPLTIGLVAVVVFFLGFAGTYSVTRALVLGGRDPLADALQTEPLKSMFDNLYGQLEQMYASRPAKTDAERQANEFQVQTIREIRQHPVETAWVVLPSGLFLFGAFSAWLNYMLSRAVLPRFGHPIPAPTPLQEFRLPTWSVWVFAIATFATARVATQPSIINAPWWVQVLLNVVTPIQFIFVLVGIAAAYGFMRKKELSKAISSVIILAAFFVLGLGMAVQVFVILAMWDTIFDFRGLGHGLFRRREEHP